MKKLMLALTAAAAFTGSAVAADLPARTYSKAPAPVAYAPSWTGCYVGGGGGYGLWDQENTTFLDGPPRTQLSDTQTTGGRGYFGTVQGGCDYQFSAMGNQFVIGAFGDYDFSSLKGKFAPPPGVINAVGDEKMSSAWSVGGRAGWLVVPSLLTYFSAGYTEATFDRINFTNLATPPFGVGFGTSIEKRTSKGWFLGAGDEYALNFLPGLFWKTEYRFSQFDTETNPIRLTANGLPGGVSVDSKTFVHTVRSELTYHFNWGGPVVAKY
jgi:outer membrane immunogenic protein